ncbi:hypothetical protein ET33_02210 [Paenibacillus tyrfis]|uniref:Uncharacterized protein n=1 Tax=Paenibacillus tyrfis TaxID=1501230 RepID=A0A081P4D3_9BACL|nr:hypothetical protein ET33_02210 [Paenibacillus tyrfis]
MLEHAEGKQVVVHQITDGALWCYENKPVRYRVNKRGDRVIDFDPACILSPYSPENLIVTDDIPLQDGGWGAKYRHERRR